MAADIEFSPFIGWVDATDPNNIPNDVRIITASDLLRYEVFGRDGSARINEHDDQIIALQTQNGTQETTLGTLTTWKGTVDTDITNLKKQRALSTKTANYTTTAADSVIIGNGASITITLLSAVTATAGRVFTVKNKHSSTLTVGSAAGTIDGAATKTLAQWAVASFVSDGTNWFVI